MDIFLRQFRRYLFNEEISHVEISNVFKITPSYFGQMIKGHMPMTLKMALQIATYTKGEICAPDAFFKNFNIDRKYIGKE